MMHAAGWMTWLDKQRPTRIGALAGWLGGAFLLGIFWHSMWPYAVFVRPWTVIIGGVGVLISLLIRRWTWTWIVWLCLLSAFFGFWRFECVTPPPGLVPFSTKGLAVPTLTNSTPQFLAPVSRWHLILTERAYRLFPEDEASVLVGVLYGEHRLSRPLHEEFQQAGFMHLIAVSGFKVTLLSSLMMPVLVAGRLSRRQAFFVTSLGLIFFVAFVSPNASVVRAALMGWLVGLAPLVGRRARPSRLLLVAACVFCYWQPWALLYDVSFALSFLGFWGLLTWSPWFASFFPWPGRQQVLVAICAMALGATLMTVPYAAWAFHQVTLWTVLTNLLVILCLPWLMAIGLATLLFPGLPGARMVTHLYLKAILAIAAWPQRVGFGYWTQIVFSWSSMLAWYACLWCVWRVVHMGMIHKKLSANAGRYAPINSHDPG